MAQNSQTPPTDSDNFKVIFEAALEAYKKKTKQSLEGHALLTQLESCNSPTAILDPTINVLYAFSATLGDGVGGKSGICGHWCPPLGK